MRKEMVECEDGRTREARLFGEEPREEDIYTIWKASVRVKGKHVDGEAWVSSKTSVWYFLTDTAGKYGDLLPRQKDRPVENGHHLQQSPSIRVK